MWGDVLLVDNQYNHGCNAAREADRFLLDVRNNGDGDIDELVL